MFLAIPVKAHARRALLAALIAPVAAMPAAALAAPVAAPAQTSTGLLTGTIVDLAGKALGNVRVTIASAASSRTVLSKPDGTFSASVAPDTYTVSVSANGFEGTYQDGITVLAGLTASVHFSLANATLQTIGRTSVTRATAINTTTAASAGASSQTFLDQGQNQVVNVLDQLPGVEVNRDSSNEPGANTSISIRGAQPYESQILVDGHPVVTSANGAYGFNSTFVNSLLLGDVEVDKGSGNLPITIEDAVGGTLNFRTPTITGGPTATLLAGYDSFNGNYYAVKASDTFGKLGVLIGLANNQTPGYLTPQNLYGGAVTPGVSAGTAYEPGRIGVVDYGYHATSNFASFSQLAKLSYSFSPQTSILLTQYSTQTNDDETGTNDQFDYASIVACIQKKPAGVCAAGGTGQNYTSATNQNLIGQNVPLNLYAPYPNTTQFDNEPIYAAEFRTVIGPGSLLARYYTGSINRVITQAFAPYANIPCSSPACPSGDDLTTTPPTYNSYYGEPYVEDTIDILHGIDAQYTLPVGNGSITAGFDRHVDTATFGEFDPTEGPPSFPQNIVVQSLAYSLRGNFAITPKLTLESGNYLSSTSYVGNRFDFHDGLVYRVNPSATLRASYGTAYVAPYYQLLNPSSYIDDGTLNLATTNFKAETSAGYDFGTDVKLGRDTIVKGDAYLTNIFNRYALTTAQATGTFDGKPYTMITQNGNQANVRTEGVELQVLHAPRVGIGYHGALDLLRDYAYNQDKSVTQNSAESSIFNATPGDYVQLPTYPYMKLRNDLFYSFENGAQARFSATSYGQNNAFGQAGFTEFDGELRLPLKGKLIVNLGGTNLFNHDDYQAGGIYDGGPTFASLSGGVGYTTRFFVQPRTLYIQLQRSIGPSGSADLSRTSL